MKRMFILALTVLMLAACGTLSEDGLLFKTADERLNIGFRLLPAPDAPPLPPSTPAIVPPTATAVPILPTITPTPCDPVIKGNLARDGRKLYHMPSSPNYNQVVPEEVFCTEADAQAAGFAKAGN